MQVGRVYSKLDLHTHTTASDGICSPTELVASAIQNGLRVLAVTDHDSTEGIAEAMAVAQGSSLELWPGVEVSTDVPGTEVHVLGYMVDYRDPNFLAKLRELRDSRLGRAERMVAKLAELGIKVSWERVQQIAGSGSVGRPHVAQAMLEKGYVNTIAEAFDHYIGRTGPAYVERYRLTPEEAVELIVGAKGFAALAHPVIVSGDHVSQLDLHDLLPRLVPVGLSGIEVYYPGYSPEITHRLQRFAAQWDLIGTGGSDFHGRGTLTTGVGSIPIPERVIDLVRERHSQAH